MNQIAITPAIQIAAATIAQIMFATDGIDRIYWRRISGWIAMTRSAVSAIDWEAQLLRCDLISSKRGSLCFEISQ